VSQPWTLSTLLSASRGPHTPPWTCQLIHAHAAGGAFVFDFVAMEACPVDAPACPRFAPFTMHIIRGDPADRTGDHLLAGWAARADVVTIVAGLTDGTRWLCLSTDEGKHLVLELPLSAPSGEDESSEP
jgi:hypothetical protein